VGRPGVQAITPESAIMMPESAITMSESAIIMPGITDRHAGTSDHDGLEPPIAFDRIPRSPWAGLRIYEDEHFKSPCCRRFGRRKQRRSRPPCQTWRRLDNDGMPKSGNDDLRVTVLATLDVLEVGIVEFAEVFADVAQGESLDPQRAENLGALCRQLLLNIGETQAAVRLSGDSPGVH
jgi:hypothetical protein